MHRRSNFAKTAMAFNLFLSHVEDCDSNSVHRISELLLSWGIGSFIANRDIPPGKPWREELKRALAHCDGVVVFLRPEARQSEWVDHEVGFALGLGCPVVSVVMVKGFKAYGFIDLSQSVVSWQTDEDLARQLFQAFLSDKRCRAKLTRLQVQVLAQSRKREQVERAADVLLDLDVTPASIIAEIRDAMLTNPVILSDPRLRRRMRPLMGDDRV